MKPFKCFVANCPNDPEHICKCTPEHTIFCSSHARNHMTKKFEKPHEWIDLYFQPNPESRLLVIEKVNELKKEIRSRLDSLASQYIELLTTIESSLSIAIEKYHKLDAECNDIIFFATQDRVLNMPTEYKIEEPLQLDPEECKKIIKCWKFPEIESDLDKLKAYIENLYEILEVNPFQRGDKSTVNSEEIHFIRNNSTDLNIMNLSLMQTSKKILNFSKKDSQSVQYNRFGANYSFNSSGLGSALMHHDFLIFFNGTISFYNNWGDNNEEEAWTFMIDKDKNMIMLESGTKSTSPALTYYKNYVYVLGGVQNGVSEKYDVKRKTWENLAPLPQGCFCSPHSALFEDKILITAICLTQIMIYDIIRNSYTQIQNLKLNNSLNKSILSYNERVYVLEFGRNIYQSEIGDISKWELIGNNQLSNCIVQSYSVAFKGGIYFVNRNNQLIEFNLKTKMATYITFTQNN
ncbi:unnamed protein product [Blepharisma stoltei]|uniref:Kelch motif family protein n=1 Tax=Blepharisma stoltei TaxID=1481888 RepID=A0AAU9ITP8_9CILI|nr:unnamed protein product [Blepharisma stoltei]